MNSNFVLIFKRTYPSGHEGWITTIVTAPTYEVALEEAWSRPTIGPKDQITEVRICKTADFMVMELPS